MKAQAPPSIVRREDPVLLDTGSGEPIRRSNARVNTCGVDSHTVELLDMLLPPVYVLTMWCCMASAHSFVDLTRRLSPRVAKTIQRVSR